MRMPKSDHITQGPSSRLGWIACAVIAVRGILDPRDADGCPDLRATRRLGLHLRRRAAMMCAGSQVGKLIPSDAPACEETDSEDRRHCRARRDLVRVSTMWPCMR